MRRPYPLRRTLVIGIVALLAVLTAAVGVFSIVALRENLIGRLDDQLVSATDRSFRAFDEGDPGADGSGAGHEAPPEPPPGSEVLGMPGQREGTLAGGVVAGSVETAEVITEAGTLRSLDADQLAALAEVPVDGVPRTVDLGDLGSYRVIIRSTGAGDTHALLMGLPLADADATLLQLTLLVTSAGVLGVGVAAAAGTLVVRLALRPLDRIASAATRVAGIPLDHGDVALPVRVESRDADPATEVGQVGAAFNVMLDHVSSAFASRQASEDKLRRFVADASHELRTPLASIRGYAELTRRSPDPLPGEAAHTLSRIEAESVRMTALVEDLLLLARLDEGGAVTHDEVDLTRLIADAVSDANAAGPDHRWLLEVPPEPVVVAGDALRLHQVVANLLANARVHTPPGTEVTAAVREAGAAAVVEVRDSGPGIDPELLPTVFERFVRGDDSRARRTGSTGLGLAISAAIVEAHGGSLEVASGPGETVFTMTLPAA